MLLIRNVTRSDLAGLKRLASMLDTVNLPNDEKALTELIDKSVRSFAGTIRNPFEREYLFVAEDTRRNQLVGTSMVIAQHGTFESPHVYLEVSEREHYSSTLGVHKRHKVLSIGYNYDGPTEIGGLIVDPAFRGGELRVGKQLSFVRFLFMAMHRKSFRDRVLAELLPPLLPDGRSLLWEAYGRKFTGLTYLEADRLSRASKEFIKELFPPTDVYATLFPERVQRVIGRVGPNTLPVKRMLEKVGFEYVERIDPFDGGPHFEAKLADIVPIRRYRRLKVSERDLDLEEEGELLLIGVEGKGRQHRFRAARTACRIDGESCTLPAEVKALLSIDKGDRVSAIPFD